MRETTYPTLTYLPYSMCGCNCNTFLSTTYYLPMRSGRAEVTPGLGNWLFGHLVAKSLPDAAVAAVVQVGQASATTTFASSSSSSSSSTTYPTLPHHITSYMYPYPIVHNDLSMAKLCMYV